MQNVFLNICDFFLDFIANYGFLMIFFVLSRVYYR